MRLLGFVIAGVIIGYIAGTVIGENRASQEAGWLAFLVVEDYQAHFGNRGALLGGIVGAVAAFASAGGEDK